MKTKIERTFKNVEEHYAEIRRIFENWGATVLGVTAEYDESCDPGTGFVITLRGKANSVMTEMAGKALTNYAYRLEWTQ